MRSELTPASEAPNLSNKASTSPSGHLLQITEQHARAERGGVSLLCCQNQIQNFTCTYARCVCIAKWKSSGKACFCFFGFFWVGGGGVIPFSHWSLSPGSVPWYGQSRQEDLLPTESLEKPEFWTPSQQQCEEKCSLSLKTKENKNVSTR